MNEQLVICLLISYRLFTHRLQQYLTPYWITHTEINHDRVSVTVANWVRSEERRDNPYRPHQIHPRQRRDVRGKPNSSSLGQVLWLLLVHFYLKQFELLRGDRVYLNIINISPAGVYIIQQIIHKITTSHVDCRVRHLPVFSVLRIHTDLTKNILYSILLTFGLFTFLVKVIDEWFVSSFTLVHDHLESVDHCISINNSLYQLDPPKPAFSSCQRLHQTIPATNNNSGKDSIVREFKGTLVEPIRS